MAGENPNADDGYWQGEADYIRQREATTADGVEFRFLVFDAQSKDVLAYR